MFVGIYIIVDNVFFHFNNYKANPKLPNKAVAINELFALLYQSYGIWFLVNNAPDLVLR
jgi:hypothetical protein